MITLLKYALILVCVSNTGYTGGYSFRTFYVNIVTSTTGITEQN